MLTDSLESGTAEEKGEEVLPRVETRGTERGGSRVARTLVRGRR